MYELIQANKYYDDMAIRMTRKCWIDTQGWESPLDKLMVENVLAAAYRELVPHGYSYIDENMEKQRIQSRDFVQYKIIQWIRRRLELC